MAAILKIINGGYHKNQEICPHIVYALLHSWPSIHNMSCTYSHADQSYSNFEFSVVASLNLFNGGYYKNQVICPQIWYDFLYSWPSIHKFSCKYHMYNKVIEIMSFQWRPFWKFKMAVTAAARSRVYISHMIITIKNYQYTKFQAFMTIWTILVFDVS